jgi:DNA-binding CsgD family transcriptional regulator/tetratricopeptide (TPR) repeat protein
MDAFLERGIYLQELSVRFDAARKGHGSLVFVGGEAGVGKTTLAKKFCEIAGSTVRVAWGICDSLSTPSALSPVVEIADALDGALTPLFDDLGRRHIVFRSLLDRLRSPNRASLLVAEDIHLADEATLDFLRFVGRRIGETTALLIATYRNEEVGSTHPVRVLLGDLAALPEVRRMNLPPLSEAAVRVIATGSGLDAELLHRRTGGNPFFIGEILTSGEPDMPATVLDAVLARASRLSGPARAALEACAVVGVRVEPWLLERVAAPGPGAIDECLSKGMLQAAGGLLAFRHDLTREAILRSLSVPKTLGLERAVLAALRGSHLADSDPARLAHHAEAADDVAAVQQYAPEAARRAAALGAHREAAAQYARALRFADGSSPETRTDLLERHAYQCFLIARFDDAIALHERALEHRRAFGNSQREGRSLRELSRMLLCVGRPVEAERRAQEAVALLERLPPNHELAMAYSTMSSTCMNVEDAEGTLSWGARALELAQSLDDQEVIVHTLNNIGTIELLRGLPDGREKLERSLTLAHEAGFEEHVGRAYIHLGWAAARTRRFDLADRLATGLEYATERDLYLWRLWLIAFRSRLELDQGRWNEAADSAGFILHYAENVTVERIPALSVLALVRARRGDADVWPLLDEARALAQPTKQLQFLAPVAAATAEVAWLEGDVGAIDAATRSTFERALEVRDPWTLGEVGYWRWRAGLLHEPPPGSAEPYALMIDGAWHRASERWREIGCPYETALALAQSDGEEALRAALQGFKGLGARPMTAVVTQKLRQLGVRSIPRGPRRSTAASPVGLTAREMEVLNLLADGLSYQNIARRLYVSSKTVEHHVSSVLAKLGVRGRGEAIKEAARRGLVRFPTTTSKT